MLVVINYWWWLWHSSGCGGGDSLCKGGSCNSCRRAVGMCTMCGKVYDEGGSGCAVGIMPKALTSLVTCRVGDYKLVHIA